MQKAQKNGFGIVGILIIIAAVAVLGGFFGYQYLNLQKIQKEAKPIETATPPPASTENIEIYTSKSSENIFINKPYGLQFTLPAGYFAGSNHFGVSDPAEAEAFFFRRKSNSYSVIPVLDVSANLKLDPGQTLGQFAQSVYDMNKAKNYVTTDLESSIYIDVNAYEFSLQSGYIDPNGYRIIELPGAKIVFLHRNGKLFEFLQTGNDTGLTSILESIKFK